TGGGRVQVTVDFTGGGLVVAATASLRGGISKSGSRSATYELAELAQWRRDIPVIRDFRPAPHSSRKGWSAKYTCYRENPFLVDIDDPRWETTGGETLSLREMAGRTTRYFWPTIRRFADPFTLRLIGSVMRGRAPSLLELD